MGKLIPRLIGEDVELVLHTSPDLGTISRGRKSYRAKSSWNLAVNARDGDAQGRKTSY